MIRTIAVWCPDWPIRAVRAEGVAPADAPVALVEKGLVFACSATARVEGVRRGLRVREAQGRCPELVVLPYDAELDARVFEPVLEAIEAVTPGVQVLRPGTVQLRSRGPARFYGDERRAAAVLLDTLAGAGVPDARIGVADGPFTALRAARLADADPVAVVEPGASGTFLAPFPIGVLDDDALVTVLRRLGITTLGGFAALGGVDVLARFGAAGARAHLAASGRDDRRIVPRVPPVRYDVAVDFEPPIDGVDQLAFALRVPAESFVGALTRARTVCTELGVTVVTERGERTHRVWRHPCWFTSTDVVDRVRWQLGAGAPSPSGTRADGTHVEVAELDPHAEAAGRGVARVELSPARIDSALHHEAGLWGGGPDERIHHALSRVQGMLGHDAVATPVLVGGRVLAQRQVLVPWGDRPPTDRIALDAAGSRRWPGSLPPPVPSSVFPDPVSVMVVDAQGDAVTVGERGEVSAAPATLTAGRATPRQLVGWAGPWPIDDRWWDRDRASHLARFQLLGADGTAWLVVCAQGEWWLEARYD